MGRTGFLAASSSRLCALGGFFGLVTAGKSAGTCGLCRNKGRNARRQQSQESGRAQCLKHGSQYTGPGVGKYRPKGGGCRVPGDKSCSSAATTATSETSSPFCTTTSPTRPTAVSCRPWSE